MPAAPTANLTLTSKNGQETKLLVGDEGLNQILALLRLPQPPTGFVLIVNTGLTNDEHSNSTFIRWDQIQSVHVYVGGANITRTSDAIQSGFGKITGWKKE